MRGVGEKLDMVDEVLGNEVAENAEEGFVEAEEEAQPVSSLPSPIHAYAVRT